MSQESLASLGQTELLIYVTQHTDEQLFKEYIKLSKDDQLKVYTNLPPEKQTMIWKEYENEEARKRNPFHGLKGEELEREYFALSKDDQLKAYELLTDNQKAHVWKIFEKQKAEEKGKEKEHPESTSERGPDDKKVQTIMSLPSAARKEVLATYDDKSLVEFYKKVTIPAQQMTLWQELNSHQQGAILKAVELHNKEKNLKSLECKPVLCSV